MRKIPHTITDGGYGNYDIATFTNPLWGLA